MPEDKRRVEDSKPIAAVCHAEAIWRSTEMDTVTRPPHSVPKSNLIIAIFGN